MENRRYGRVEISELLVSNHPDIVAKIFAKLKMVVLHCEYLYDYNKFKYRAYSPLFDIVELGTVIPKYEICVTTQYDEKGNITDFDANVRRIPDNFRLPTHPSTLELMIDSIERIDNG